MSSRHQRRKIQQDLDLLLSPGKPNKNSTRLVDVRRERMGTVYKHRARPRVSQHSAKPYLQTKKEVIANNTSQAEALISEEENSNAGETAYAWSDGEMGYQHFVEVKSPKSPIPISKTDHDDDDNDDMIIEEDCTSLEDINARLSKIERQNEQLIKSQRIILRQLIALRTSTAARGAQEEEPELSVHLPAATVADFVELEADCVENEKTARYLATLFNNTIQHDLTKFIALSLTKIISDGAATTFSWHGQQNNIPVKDYSIMKLLINTAIKKFPGVPETDVINLIKKWFQRAKDRSRKSNKLNSTQ